MVGMWRWMGLCGCVWLAAGMSQTAQAQLSIDLSGGDVKVQNGKDKPLVVKWGQSFGGTLTSKGFQGVMSDANGVRRVEPGMANPFREEQETKPVAPAKKKGMKINAGGVSISLPGDAAPAPRMMKAEPLAPKQLMAAKTMVRTMEPSLALKEIDRMLMRHPMHADLMHLKAVLLMKQEMPQEAAACAYDALAAGEAWSWPMLRSCFPQRDAAETMYRDLQQDAKANPTCDRQFLLAWWERMLGHPREAMTALEQAMADFPDDPLMERLHAEWSDLPEPEAPPAVAR